MPALIDGWKKPPRMTRLQSLLHFFGLYDWGLCVWCPKCGNEMESDSGTIYKGHPSRMHGRIKYQCAECGNWSMWDMSPPVPVLLYTQAKDRRLDAGSY